MYLSILLKGDEGYISFVSYFSSQYSRLIFNRCNSTIEAGPDVAAPIGHNRANEIENTKAANNIQFNASVSEAISDTKQQ